MKTIFFLVLFFSAGFFGSQYCTAQDRDTVSQKDTTFVFGELKPRDKDDQPSFSLQNSWGADLLLSTNGFGLGFFYRHEYTEDLAGYIDLIISEAKDDQEVERYDYYGNSFVLGKVNRFLVMPVLAGVQYRLFRDEILDNFRPYINAAVGPTMLYVFPYNEDYFVALGKGQMKYTVGGYAGFGAYFGSERSSLFGINFRYYFVPYSGGIESMRNGSDVAYKSQFGGFYISFTLGTAW